MGKLIWGNRSFVLLLVIAVLETGCSSGFSISKKALSVNSQGSTAVSSNSASFTCSDPKALSATPMRRLSKAQYKNSLTQLFGATAVNSVASKIDQIQYDMAFEQPESYNRNFFESNIKAFFDVATGIASAVNSDQSLQSAVGGSCLTGSNPDTNCYTSTIKNFGLKVYRRPLSDSEVSAVNEVVAAGSSKQEKISGILELFLQSPYFLYQVETGISGAGTKDSPLTLSDFEIASRLSFLIWDSMPDQALFDLAAAGQLSSSSVQKQQVDRMFKVDLARAKVRNFALYWLNMNNSTHGMRDFGSGPAEYLAGLNPVGLKDEVIRESQEFVEDIVFNKNGSYADLLTSNESFARTDALASIYGHPKVTTNQPQTMSDGRHGLLMRPIFMSASSPQTSPIVRGVRLRSRVLCIADVAPGIDVISQGANITTEDMIKQYTTRQRFDIKTSGNACIGCHANINPYGAAFENFDTFGRLRSSEVDYRADGSIIATHAIDTSTKIDLGNGAQAIAGAVDLIQDIATGIAGPTCFVRQAYRYYQLKTEESDDSCVLNGMYNGLGPSTAKQGSILGSLKEFTLRNLNLKRVE